MAGNWTFVGVGDILPSIGDCQTRFRSGNKYALVKVSPDLLKSSAYTNRNRNDLPILPIEELMTAHSKTDLLRVFPRPSVDVVSNLSNSEHPLYLFAVSEV